MKYQQIGGGSSYPYPENNINPDKKGRDWCMSYAKAAYFDWSFSYPKGIFANNNGDYEKWRMYSLGKQPNSQYKKMLGVDQETNNTWLVNDWSIRSIITTYRGKTISRLMANTNGIVATPIDMTAKAELDEYYSNMKAKLAVRELIQGVNQELASHPLITLQSGEPMDAEELEMRIELGEQFNRSRDAEMAIELGFYENDWTYCRRKMYEDLFDIGVTGYKEWLGDDNKAKFRVVNPERVITNFCYKANFEDMVHAGEVIDVSLIDLSLIKDEEGNPMFTEDELQEFASSVAGKWGNPSYIGKSTGWFKPYDKFKCKVLDIEFFTYNTYSYNDAVDEYGNSDFRKAQNGRGKNSDKYKRKTIQYVYKCKWIIGTDKAYDWGMCYDQKRSQNGKKKAKTYLSYKFFAYNFYEMKAQGFMEMLIPYLDDYQLTMLKIQNWKNRAVPSGWWINLDMLENVALSKGGAAMQPKELLQMFFETGIMVGRSLDAAGNPVQGNVQPVIPMENTSMSELVGFYQDILNTVSSIEKMVGWNEITSGNPNPKTLVPGYEVANMSTNDALYPMAFAEKWLSERLAEDVLCRMQQGIKKGGISGYAPALNTNILRFIEISPAIALREYGIKLEERTTDDQKMWILQQVQQDIMNGFLDTSDAILIINTHNAKQAMSILSYRVKKAKQAMNQQKMAEIQATNQGNQQAAMIAEQGKAQALQMELSTKVKMNQDTIQGEILKKKMEVESNERIAMSKNLTAIQVAEDSGDAKENVATTTAIGKIHATHLAGEKTKEKQEIANAKPVTKSSK
jgi:hypothetical protein